jgi:hypothetical protein
MRQLAKACHERYLANLLFAHRWIGKPSRRRRSLCGSRLVAGAILNDVGTAKKQLTHAYVVPLMCHGMLRRDVKVAHATLQWRAIVNRTSAAKRETSVRDTDAGSANPDRGLRAMRKLRLVLQRSGKSVAPMACDLDLQKGLCGPQFGGETTKFALKYFRFLQRRRSPQLPSSGLGKSDDIIQRTFGHA